MSVNPSRKRKLSVTSKYAPSSRGLQDENDCVPAKARKLAAPSKKFQPSAIEKSTAGTVSKSLKRAHSETELDTETPRKKIFLSAPNEKKEVADDRKGNSVPGTSGTQQVATSNKGNRHKKTRRGKRKPKGLAAYEMGGCLGAGGFGQVFSATRKRDKLPVAIKFVKKDRVRNFKEINGKQFPVEAYYQRHICHPNIIQLLDVFTHKENFVYVLERPEDSSDLFDIMDVDDGMLEDDGRRFFTQILDATIQCEEQGILHRDIKPENIIIDLTNMDAKLTDFGLACETQEEPFRRFVGTHHYCPPEFFSHHCFFGNQATVWQLGFLLNEMLSGEMPYVKPRMALYMPPSVPKYLSKEARSLISWMLSRDPDQRPTLQQIRNHSWINK
ncbi:serine/threonine-protein kinase pim-1-like [Porites lutea]|uniref:serine/threonine-protein kinase pim-1-like n=1 Tax=Porites lutea TaxID=51062 RepID=UPI003CC52939